MMSELQRIKTLQQGGAMNMKGSTNFNSSSMVSKSQEQFAHKIAEAVTPVVIPMPAGGGQSVNVSGSNGSGATPMPPLSSADSSIVAMEYKYRITMGASV